jgi:putative redox protein
VRAKVSWVEGMRFVGSGDSGHGLLMESKSGEAPPIGSSPMEVVLMALGGCSSIDIVDILRKMRLDLASLEVAIQAERASEPPRVFTKADLEFVASGEGLTQEALRRAVDLSMEKYCSVAAMLARGGTKLTYRYRVEPKRTPESPEEPPALRAPDALKGQGAHPAPAHDLPMPGPPGPARLSEKD